MAASDSPVIDEKEFLKLYLDGDHRRLSARFIKVFQKFKITGVFPAGSPEQVSLSRFLKIFLTVFTQRDFQIPRRFVTSFINLNDVISNLVAATPFRNTDSFLELMRGDESNIVKILTLYSARNHVRFDRRSFFDARPRIASYWYNVFCRLYKTGLVREDVANHMREHFAYRDERLCLTDNLQDGFFGCTYLGGDLDRQLKPFLNDVVRRSMSSLKCVNNPNPRKIAVFSDTWHSTHSVYRNYAGFVAELKKSFHLTFFYSVADPAILDLGMFDEVQHLPFENGTLNVDRVLTNDFQAAYFPDIGMSLPSIILANHRIAPIQFCSPGHSVSTYGADIDYYFSGADAELADNAEQNYSERLVLLPGMGVIHNQPLYQPTGARKTASEVLINCPWMGQKINYKFLRIIKRLIDQLERPVRFRMFPGIKPNDPSYGPFVIDVREALGTKAQVDIFPYCPYPNYMKFMELGDLTLDSFHFSGCNTVAESLFLGKPTLVWEGDKWYNRIGPAILRLAAMDDLICTSEEDFLAKAHMLIHDDARREDYAARLRSADLGQTVFSTATAPAFVRAVNYLIANHDQLTAEGSRKPIRIE